MEHAHGGWERLGREASLPVFQSSSLPVCQFGPFGPFGQFDCPGLRVLGRRTAISGGPKMEPPSIPTAMPLENSFYFEYLARGHHSIVGIDIGDDRLHRFPLVSAWAAGNRQCGKHGSRREKKYAGALRTTHRIVSHRREPWSGLRAAAACPGAQRARIRIRNCS